MTFGMTLGDPSGDVRFIVGGVAFTEPFDKIDASLKDPYWLFFNWFYLGKDSVKNKIFQIFSESKQFLRAFVEWLISETTFCGNASKIRIQRGWTFLQFMWFIFENISYGVRLRQEFPLVS